MKEAIRSAYLDPANRRTHLLMARLHRLRGDHERALNEFRIFLWSNDDAVARVEVALLLRDMGRGPEARARGRKGPEARPRQRTGPPAPRNPRLAA